MEFYSFILISIIVFVLKPDEGVQYKKYNEDYKKYIHRVVSRIHSQIGSNEMQSLKLKQHSNNMDVQENPQLDDFSHYYRYTISVLIFKYTEILNKFLDYMHIIMNQCKQFHERNDCEQFICCVTLLEVEVKNSKTMFGYLQNAMKFISYIDIKCLFVGIIIMPNPITDEITFFQQFIKILELNFDINISPNLEGSEMKLEFFTKFYTDGLEILNKSFHYSNIIDDSIKTDLTTNKNMEYSNENNLNIVYLSCSELNSFYNETIEIWYKHLGFEQFLNPKTPEFTPPKDPQIKQDDGIVALNILLRETGWKSMNHINIVYYNKIYNLDSIISDPIDDINFRIKKEHVTKLLRCRYTEILKNYHVLLSTIFFLCNYDSFYFRNKCLIELFNSLDKSKKMLEGLHTALITLNKSSIWIVNLRSYSSLHKILEWVADILYLLNTNNFSRINFDNETDNQKANEKIKKHLANFRIILSNLHTYLHGQISYLHNWCLLTEPFYEKNEKKIFFKNLVKISNDPNTPQKVQIYLNACDYFDNFCEDIYMSCYKNLGFEKVDCRNKKLDHKLVRYLKIR
ncbi:uncharacterized protein LOC126902355 [Daktulosphaira vitifoliae]|uniref:uncharacterized protein LOC126902355 n=1 Tax=Daktulosphaira vitifoliae TaxID=58002 RepID=UPI0021AABE54|nr:uncharacterized protein LOC126902355 [Daktulosphaira vitifoliae]